MRPEGIKRDKERLKVLTAERKRDEEEHQQE
jgi:hypothetical protein